MSTPWMPDIAGLGWGQKVTPALNTLIQTSASGLEARQAEMTLTRRTWDLIFETLRQGLQQDLRGNALAVASVTQQAVEQLQGFYLNQLGPLSTFFFRDQFFNSVTNGFIATGDGSTTAFQAQRYMLAGSAETGSGPTYAEPVFCFDTRGSYTYGPYTRSAGLSPQAYVNGSPTSATFNTETGVISFGSAPGATLPITATFSYGFRCRFSEDSIDFENLFGSYGKMDSLKIIETRV